MSKSIKKSSRIRLNLGCGDKYLKNFVNTEISPDIAKADVYFDLEKTPYPFSNNYADYILMDNVLEHLEDIVTVMNELHRILKPNGVLEIVVPYVKSDGAFQDPTHKHYFTEKSMDYFTDTEYGYYSHNKFRILKNELKNANKTILSKTRMLIPFKGILRYFFFNMFDSIHFKLQPIK